MFVQNDSGRMKKTILLFIIAALPISASHAAGDVVAGKASFAKCASCHQVGASARAGFGPPLNGIIGRPAGSSKDYKYSTAMKNSGVVWSEKNLRVFLKDTDDVVPGNKMRFFGISNDKEIDNLLAYLNTFK
jgi:cytochrome c